MKSMASKKSGPEYKRAMRSVLKTELQSLLKKLAENGEESLVLTATVGDPQIPSLLKKLAENGEESLVITATVGVPQIPSLVHSKIGEQFCKKDKDTIEELRNKFHSFCQGFTHTHPKEGNSGRKRKLSISEDEGGDYTDMGDVIVYVTEGEDGNSEAVVSGNDVTSTVLSTGENEDIQQIAISTDNGEKVIFIGGDKTDQSRTLWMDYTGQSEADISSQEIAATQTGSLEGFKGPDSHQNVPATVDVTGTPQLRDASQDISVMTDSGRVLVRNEGTKLITVPISSVDAAAQPSPQRRRHQQEMSKVDTVKVETVELDTAEIKPTAHTSIVPEESPLTRYINYMATGKSIMIRAGEDCFEEIETISIADEYGGYKSDPSAPQVEYDDSQLSVDSEVSQATSTIAPSSDTEVIVTKLGNKVHIVKDHTEEQEIFDIPFEDMFELLGKSARCLVCGKVMLKRNRRYHWRFHTGTKPYVCDYCPKKFYHPSNLKSHLFIHTARNK